MRRIHSIFANFCEFLGITNGSWGEQGMMGMPQAAARTIDRDGGQAPERPIDLVHLARMTFGDRSLEREVLQLFDRQSALLLERMRAANGEDTARLAHTLKGSARGVGAWQVAAAAATVETAATGDARARDAAIAKLAAAIEQARGIIGELLRAH
jgi:HPt (histidine-containing phosphotransfer) domain-containing protein